MKIKKKITIVLGIITAVVITNTNLFAQDVEITDEDLKLYATVMNKIDLMKSEMKTKYNDLIKGEELMTGGRRFKELKSAKGDETKLTEMKATEEELAIFDKIQEEYAAMTDDFKAAYPTIIKEELGAGVYNKVKKGLKSDADLKTRYDEIVSSMEEETSESESDD